MGYRRGVPAQSRGSGGVLGRAGRGVDWIRGPSGSSTTTAAPFYRWFPDGELNTCYNALDRHVIGGRADQTALIYDSPVTGDRGRTPTPSCSRRWRGSRGALRGLGVGRATGS